MILVFLGLIWAVFSLWNWLMPAIFGLPAVTYGQALGLMLLCWILFGGFRGGRSGGGWRYGMRRRWQRMSPEEREEFIQGLRTRWGGVHPSPPGEQG
jgi:hypothetical protein